MRRSQGQLGAPGAPEGSAQLMSVGNRVSMTVSKNAGGVRGSAAGGNKPAAVVT